MSIKLTNLGKSYDHHAWTLKDVNVEIQDGEFFAVVGPSGGGKSTLLNMIAGLIPTSEGRIEINGHDVTHLPPKNRQLTMVFQSYALFPFLNVVDNIAFGLKARKRPHNEIKERVDRAIEMVGLSDLKNKYPRELSGGQRQRVAIGRAIASEAKICLMDEPLSNLDARLREKMRSRIRELQRHLGMTMIYVTHDQIEAMTMADRIMVIHDHHVQQVGTPQQIYDHPANTFVASFFGNPPMNIFPVKLTEATKQLVLTGPLALSLAKPLPAGKYQVGIRPQKLRVIPTMDDSNGRVKNIEYEGNDEVIDIDLNNGEHIQALTMHASHTQVNSPVKITTQGEYYIFDSRDRLIYESGRENE